MGRLEELIAELKLGTVRHVELNDCCTISAGGDVPKTAMTKVKTSEFNVPIISNGIGENAFYGYTNIAKITKKICYCSCKRNYWLCRIQRLSLLSNN